MGLSGEGNLGQSLAQKKYLCMVTATFIGQTTLATEKNLHWVEGTN